MFHSSSKHVWFFQWEKMWITDFKITIFQKELKVWAHLYDFHCSLKSIQADTNRMEEVCFDSKTELIPQSSMPLLWLPTACFSWISSTLPKPGAGTTWNWGLFLNCHLSWKCLPPLLSSLRCNVASKNLLYSPDSSLALPYTLSPLGKMKSLITRLDHLPPRHTL